jgi:site-specific recombinase XerD
VSERRMTQSDAWRMLQRRARTADISTVVCNHIFRATGSRKLEFRELN